MDFLNLDPGKPRSDEYTEVKGEPKDRVREALERELTKRTGPISAITKTAQQLQPNWKDENTEMQVLHGILQTIDWGQTRDIARNPDKFIERNQQLGSNPSTGKVDKHFALTELSNVAAALLIKNPELRKLFQVLSVGSQNRVAGRNQEIGIKMDF